MVLCVAMFISVCVVPGLAVDTTTDSQGVLISVFSSVEEYQEYLDTLSDEQVSTRDVELTRFTAGIVRKNGASDETCQVYVNWSGNGLISRIRYKQIKIKSTSILFAKTYGTFGDGDNYAVHFTAATTIGNVLIGEVEIPTDVDSVKLDSDDFQAYFLSDREWHSGIEWVGKVDITD